MPQIGCKMECPHIGLIHLGLIHGRCASQHMGIVAAGPVIHKQ